MLLPAGSVFDPDSLDRFAEASRRVSGEATGFPIVFRKMSGRITRGFYGSVVAGSVLVALILFLDYRNLRDVLLALLPLAVGVTWMMGGMRLLGLSFNFANLVAVPLIIGVGIDNGVHIVHRMKFEGRSGMNTVLRHTGRAILVASLTTMVGFGSLALASHRGLASLGLVLLLGVGACLVASTVVLPNLLILLGIARR
jgi:predicted RND superfamily exporter protein